LTGNNIGVFGDVSSPDGYGVEGRNPSITGNGVGVIGVSSSQSGTGVGTYGQSQSPTGYGVFGHNAAGGFGLGTRESAFVGQDLQADNNLWGEETQIVCGLLVACRCPSGTFQSGITLGFNTEQLTVATIFCNKL
jgi:hypothetical protein